MYAVVQIPDFRLQSVLRIERGLRKRAMVLVDPQASKPLVDAMTEAARLKGVSIGMSVSQAMARCPELATRYRSASAEILASRALFAAAYGVSPRVEESDEGICTINLRGVDTKTLEKQLDETLRQLRKLNLTARLGVAETPDLAWLAAKHSKTALRIERSREERPRSSEVEEKTAPYRGARTDFRARLRAGTALLSTSLDGFLDTLPVGELEASESMLSILELWGIRSAGAFAHLSRQAVSDRLGSEGTRLWDRLTGREERMLRYSEPEEKYEESLDFEYDLLNLEPILFVARRFLDQLEIRLKTAHLAADALLFELILDHAKPIRLMMKVPDPTAEADILFRMLSARAENLSADNYVVGLRLRIDPVERDERQLGLFETALKNPHRFSQTLARVAGIVGVERVGMPVLETNGRPDGFTLERLPSTVPPLGAESGLRERFGFALRRYRPALEAEVEMQGRVPVWFRCEKEQGYVEDVRGPWTHSGRWWETGGWNRVEWDVQLRKGGLYRLVLENGKWFVEGMYD